MGRVLTYEIPEEIYAALERMAAQAHMPAEAYVLEYLARRAGSRRHPTEQEVQGGLDHFEPLIGSVDPGRRTGIDNDAIDADLARAYGDSEPEPR